MARRGHRRTERAISIKIEERDVGNSVSLTIYPGNDTVPDIARYIQTLAERRWKTTRIDDRRHKRR